MSISLRLGVVLLIATLYSSVLYAQQKNNIYTIEIKGEQINTLLNGQYWLDSMTARKTSDHVQVIVQFYQLPNDQQKRLLSQSGISLVNYVASLSYTAMIHFPVSNVNITATGIRSIISMRKEWKIDERIINTFNLQTDKQSKLLVSFVSFAPKQEIEELLQRIKGKITDRRFEIMNTFEIELPQNRIYQLSENPFVKYINLPADIKPLNFDARSSSGANMLVSPIVTGGYHLDGGGVTVGVGDNGSAVYHVDARDRVVNFNPASETMHGIHTTLTVAGKGIMDPRTLGMAPSAKILNHIYDIVWAQTPHMYHNYNMTVTNNSYASTIGDCMYAGTYDQSANLLDAYQKAYPYVQHVFASGNDGPLQCGSFPLSYATITGGYQPAKNILTVGAMAKDNIIWPKSSRGPVKDGRLKPEIMAYGYQIYSGNIFDMYGGSNGTSMSSPVVAGNLVLLEQRYKQLNSNQNMPSDLMKVLAMNGATDMGNPGPDFLHGYGLINTYRSVQMLENNRFFIDSVNNTATKNHSITVPANTTQLKVMLYWHDDPASPFATNTLVNNLDMELTTPSAITHRPLILDPAPANVTNNAVEGIDNVNNSEQIVVNNPTPGNYNITVKGTSLPAGKQRYVLAFDFIASGVKMKYPVAGVPVLGNDSLYVYWDANTDNNTFTLEYSDNNGSNWNTISNNVPAAQRHFVWYTPNTSSSQCLFRITRNNTSQSDITGPFVINPQPIVQLGATQCPGYMAVEWTAVTGASSYEVLRKIGDDLRPIDTVTTTNYTISGLSFDSIHYVAICPLINGLRGWRSKAVSRRPNDGDCSRNISDGDLAAAAIIRPKSGRLFTSTACTNNDTLSVFIRNLDDAPVNNYRISYRLNGGMWQSQTWVTPILPLGSIVVDITGQNLSTPGIYKYEVAITNLASTDPVGVNDTIVKFIRQLDNQPININNKFTEDFENSTDLTVLTDTIGIFTDNHWDYFNSTDSGRLRSFVSDDVLIDGQHSVSLDLQLNKPDNQNYLIGTFNLQNFDAANTEARIEFDYKIHGKPKFEAGNEVWVRGRDTDAWVSLYTIDTSAIPGQRINTGSLSLSHALATALQNFSSSFQVRIGQRDTSVIAMNEYGNGMTIDNFRLYSVKNDVILVNIITPVKFNCGIDSTALGIRVYNSDNLPQDTIELFYSLNNGPVIKDTILFLDAKDTVTHFFKDKLPVAAIGQHSVSVWLRAQGDSYLSNDSVLNYRFRNQPNVTSFPYLENFEAGDGNWYTEGTRSSWQYGVPNSHKQKIAASGAKVWATNLTGNYNDNELSYLYSPCFNISSLENPMLSFSLSTHIENCGGTLCDAAYMEYSEDGINWTKLGKNGEGYNWYGELGVWSDSVARWRVASISLPKNIPSLKLRFVLKSDQGASWDGIAIDDIHIFDLKYPIYDGNTTSVSNSVNANASVSFTEGDKLLAQINTNDRLDNTTIDLYNRPYVLHPITHNYNLQRSFVVNTGIPPTNKVQLRLYITDQDILNLLADRNCDTCSKATDAYRLGITKYHDKNKQYENGSLADNVQGQYSYIPYTSIQWVPYDKGYYAQFDATSFSEFWFNTGIPRQTSTKVFFYPNPVTKNKLTIVWNSSPGTICKLLLFDVLGRKIYEATSSTEDFDSITTFNIPDMETGIYTLRFLVNDEIFTDKLLIKKEE